MSEFLTVRHSFNAGDLITVLPGLADIFRQTGKKTVLYQRLNLPAHYYDGASHPIQKEGAPVCMNREVFNLMKPLVLAQEYIHDFLEWQGEPIDIDFDSTRHDARIPLPGGDIHAWAYLVFPQLCCDLSQRWIEVNGVSYADAKMVQDRVIINRTERYRNPYISYAFLKPHEHRLFFIGTQKEHYDFCTENKLTVERLPVDHFLQLARYILSCKFFMGNQSLCWHIADAMKKERVLEVCTEFPNVFPSGRNGYAFVAQQAVEYFFDKLLNAKS